MDVREQRAVESSRILVGLRDRLIADALARLLSDAGFYVSGCFCDPSALLEQAARSLPDAVVVGVDMLCADPDLSLLDALRRRAPGVRAVVMVRDVTERDARAMVQLGVSGVIGFGAAGNEAIAVLRHVLAGQVVYPSAMLSRLAGGSEPELLSERQREVLEQIALGRSNDEIAQSLFISRNTVKFHLREIYARLGVRNRVEASRAARVALGDGLKLSA